LATGAGIAGGTAALNSYFNRDWKQGILRNALIGIATTIAIGSISYIVGISIIMNSIKMGSDASAFCILNPDICENVNSSIITDSQITGSKGNILNITGFQQTVINGITYSGYAIDRMIQNGISPSVIEEAMEYEPIVGNTPLTQVFYDPVNNVRVVQDILTGIIVTLGYGKP
jgi:hypothetical protein